MLDNLETGNSAAVKWGLLIVGSDLMEISCIQFFEDFSPSAVMHFAANAYVGESTIVPMKYYKNNVSGMQVLLSACVDHGVNRFILSSSCATYGIPAETPITEANSSKPHKSLLETRS